MVYLSPLLWQTCIWNSSRNWQSGCSSKALSLEEIRIRYLLYNAKKVAVEELLSHLNRVRPSIRFTVEMKKDECLPFYTLLQRRDDGGLPVTIYRKLTDTTRYLDFHSHHLLHGKRGLVRCLYNRARSITTKHNSL